MRYASWQHGAATHCGVVVEQRVHPFGSGGDLGSLLGRGAGALRAAGAAAAAGPGVPLADVRLLPPVTPPSVRDFLAFHEHLEGVVARFGHPVFLDLEMAVEVNGVVVGTDTLASMSWTFEELVAYASRGTWVRPGDVIGSGTCGSGCLAELWGRRGVQDPPALVPGDVVTMSVTGLGSISNRVVRGTEPACLPRARSRPVRQRAGVR